MYVGLAHFLGVLVINFNIWAVSDFYFFFLGGGGEGGGSGDFVDIWGIITKLEYFKGSFLCILGSFLKVNVQNGIFFFFLGGGGGGPKISNIFWVCLLFLIYSYLFLFYGGGGSR